MVGIFGSPLFDDVLSIVKNWKPRKKYSNEAGYRDDLMEYIRKKLNEQQSMFGLGPTEKHIIRKEDSRSLADIGIDRKIGIELKLNLTKKSQRNRLIGQINDYIKDYEYIIVVLCGKTNESEYEELCDDVRRISPGGIIGGSQTVIRIIKITNNNRDSLNICCYRIS